MKNEKSSSKDSDRILRLIAAMLGSSKPKVFPYGDVVVFAVNESDMRRFLYVASYPRSVGLERLKELVCSKPSISIAKERNETKIIVSDIASGDLALVIGSRLAKELSMYSPYGVRRVDVITTYRSSEDGGISVRNSIEIVVDDRFTDPSTIRRIVEKISLEVLEAFCVEQ